MEKDIQHKVLLGFFILLGTALFIAGVYFIGAKKNMFNKTFHIVAIFNDVNGLQNGDNIRYRGLDVGTIQNIEVTDDSSVVVSMVIEKSMKLYIKKNSIASIGTDGLMGNKIVNLHSGSYTVACIEEGDTLRTLRPVETDEVFRALGTTAKNIAVITENLKTVTTRINNSNGLWTLLNDSTLDQNLKQTLVNIKLTSKRSAIVVGDLSKIARHIEDGKGSIGALLADTSLSNNMKQSVVSIHMVSDKMALVSGDLSIISGKIKNGEGTIGTLLTDTVFLHNLNQSMVNIKNGSKGLDENMEALKHSFFLRKYFRKKEKFPK
jgi:phospholipid/cholesterol/gamma-HCH transport system substrate-binding protein